MPPWTLAIIGSGTGLSPVRRQGITGTNADLLSIEHTVIVIQENIIKMFCEKHRLFSQFWMHSFEVSDVIPFIPSWAGLLCESQKLVLISWGLSVWKDVHSGLTTQKLRHYYVKMMSRRRLTY